ncbi:carboxylesterase [Paraphaeosphaeria sporulosa]
MRVFEFLAVGAALGLASKVERVVDLGYAKYKGRSVGDGTTQWLGMRYAAPPLGELRFRAPVDPLPSKPNTIQDASKFGNICLAQSPDDWTYKPTKRFTVGEDCLFVNVFAPEGKKKGLPVMFFIQGGGFTSNSNANANGSDLARIGDMVVVSINYRVGPYGFLMGDEVVNGGGSTNNGIRDQLKALEWTKKHVSKFGGDPNHIILNGASAGATSIVILMGSPSVKGRKLFKGVIAESTALVQLKTLEEGQVQYDCLAKAAGCSGNSSLECLRKANTTALLTKACNFSPSSDKDILPSPLLMNAAYADTLRNTPSIFGTTADEGTDFAPNTTNSTAEFRGILAYIAPFLSSSALDGLVEMYASGPQPAFPNVGNYWRATSNAYGDIAFKCPTRAYAGQSSWVYDWVVPDPEDEASGSGAYHTVEKHAIWGPNNTDGNPPKSYRPGGVNAGVVPLMQGYVTSFVRWLDPNVGRAEGAPRWEKAKDGKTLRIGGVSGSGVGSLEEVEGKGFAERCKRLRPVLGALEVTPPAGTKVDLAEG